MIRVKVGQRKHSEKTVIPEKTCIYTKNEVLTAWMGDPWSNIFWQRATRLKEHTSTRLWENCWGLQSDSVNGGIVSVLEFALASKTTEKLIILRLDCLESSRFSDGFILNADLKVTLLRFFLVARSNFNCLFSGPLCSPELFHKFESDVFIIFFFSILRTDFDETHVCGF